MTHTGNETGRLSAYPDKELLEDFQIVSWVLERRSGSAQVEVLMRHFVDANRDVITPENREAFRQKRKRVAQKG